MAFGQPAGSPIKSVQRGTISIVTYADNVTSTISSVDVDKSFISYLGMKIGANFGPIRLALTNSTTVTATVGVAQSGTRLVGYAVVEYN